MGLALNPILVYRFGVTVPKNHSTNLLYALIRLLSQSNAGRHVLICAIKPFKIRIVYLLLHT